MIFLGDSGGKVIYIYWILIFLWCGVIVLFLGGVMYVE